MTDVEKIKKAFEEWPAENGVYALGPDFKTITTKKLTALLLKAVEMAEYFIRSYPTDERGNHCEVNQPQAIRARAFLDEMKKALVHE